jgi:hypothetical protein
MQRPGLQSGRTIKFTKIELLYKYNLPGWAFACQDIPEEMPAFRPSWLPPAPQLPAFMLPQTALQP